MQNSIPNNWQKVKLGEIVNVYGGGTPSTQNSSYWNGNIPWLTPAELTNYNSRYIAGTASYITEPGLSNSSAKIMPENSILLTSRATIGNAVINTIPMATNQGFINIEPKQVDRIFFYYWLRNNKNFLNQIAIGSTFPELSKSVFKEIQAFIPKEVEQQRQIASILSAFDDKIELNNKIAKNLEEMAQGIFNEWFVNFRFPGYEKVEFVDSEVGEIPGGWKVVKFQEYAKLEYGKALQEEKRRDGNILVYGSSGRVGIHDEKLCMGPGIVVGRKGNVGSVFWVDDDFYPIDTTFYLSTENSLYYIYFILKNLRFHTGDSAVPGLTRESVYNEDIVIPDIALVNKFENFVKPIFKKRNLIQNENQKLAALRDLLLPKLMKGEIKI